MSERSTNRRQEALFKDLDALQQNLHTKAMQFWASARELSAHPDLDDISCRKVILVALALGPWFITRSEALQRIKQRLRHPKDDYELDEVEVDLRFQQDVLRNCLSWLSKIEFPSTGTDPDLVKKTSSTSSIYLQDIYGCRVLLEHLAGLRRREEHSA